MAEFSLIERFCQSIGQTNPHTQLSVGDDAAVLRVPQGCELAVSVDTMVEGIHFLADSDPAQLAHKILAVNLSDMAAMGAEPKWATLALTLPVFNEQWLSAFSSALNRLAKHYGVQLIGGDTTQGPLNLSLQIMGLLPTSKRLTRCAAKVGDKVFVSNTVGDAALALKYLLAPDASEQGVVDQISHALHQPTPQVELGGELLTLANACIDVSDGLVADLTHIAQRSAVSILLDIEAVPISQQFKQYLQKGGSIDLALTGGDDYQLAFTVGPAQVAKLATVSKQLDVVITQIGEVCESTTEHCVILQKSGKPYTLSKNSGYQHFNG